MGNKIEKIEELKYEYLVFLDKNGFFNDIKSSIEDSADKVGKVVEIYKSLINADLENKSKNEMMHHGLQMSWLMMKYLLVPEYGIRMLQAGIETNNEIKKENFAISTLRVFESYLKYGIIKPNELQDDIDVSKIMFPDRKQTGIKELALKKYKDQDPDSPKSKIYLSNKKGMKVDYIRVINCMYELGFFADLGGNLITKKDVFNAFGNAINKDLSDYDKDLSRSLSDSTTLDKHLAIFELMRNKMTEIFNSK